MLLTYLDSRALFLSSAITGLHGKRGAVALESRLLCCDWKQAMHIHLYNQSDKAINYVTRKCESLHLLITKIVFKHNQG